MDEENKKIFIPTIILNVIIIFISFYLSILYIKSKRLHIIPCYNLIIFVFIILLDNILRIIPFPDDKKVMHYIQAFLLVSLDKLLLSTITFQTFITYLGVVKTKFYFRNEIKIYVFGIILNLIISFALTGTFIGISEKLAHYGVYYYCESNIEKKIIDTIYNSFYLLINTFSIVILLIYMSTKKEEAEEGMIEDLDYSHHYTKILLMFIINSIAFIESYLIIYDKLPVPNDYIDLVYLTTCLLIAVVYTVNHIIYKETIKLFCRKIYEKKYPENKKNNSISSGDSKNEHGEEKEMRKLSKSSFD